MSKNMTIVLNGMPKRLGLGYEILGSKVIAVRRGDTIEEINKYEEQEDDDTWTYRYIVANWAVAGLVGLLIGKLI